MIYKNKGGKEPGKRKVSMVDCSLFLNWTPSHHLLVFPALKTLLLLLLP